MRRLYKLPYQILLASLLLLLPSTVFSQKSIEIGLSYRYVYFEEADWSLTHARSEALQPHELDLNFRFGIGDPHLRGTFTIGYAKFGNADFTFTNLLFSTCENVTYNGYTQNFDAYRFNPGVEYQIKKGKLNYGLGAGIFYYGAFGGKKDQLFSEFYSHRDSLTGDCIEDSSFVQIINSKAPSIATALLGVSLSASANYELEQGIIFFAAFSVNPTYSVTHGFFSLSPNGSAGVYFRLRRKPRDIPK